MKSRATFAPIGPYLVTADEIRNPQKLQVRPCVNGVLEQICNTDDNPHKRPRRVERISGIRDLEPGDIIATGTDVAAGGPHHRRTRAWPSATGFVKVRVTGVRGVGRSARSIR